MIPPRHPLQLALGLALWLVWFSLAYGGLSLGCALAPPPPEAGAWTWINVLLLLSTLVVAALLLIWSRRCWLSAKTGGKGDFSAPALIAYVAAGVHLTAAVATLGVGVTTVFLPPCL